MPGRFEQRPGLVTHLPRKIYGRRAEQELALKVFELASTGTPQLLLASGGSGIGKTALIAETFLPLTQRGALCFSGKFAPTERSEPFAAWAQIFDKIIDHLLAEPESSLNNWRRKIAKALGAQAALLMGA